MLSWKEVQHFCMLVLRMSFDEVQQTAEYCNLGNLQNNPPILMSSADIGYPQLPSDLQAFNWDIGNLKFPEDNMIVQCVAFFSLSDLFLELERFYKCHDGFRDRHEYLTAAISVMETVSGRIDSDDALSLLHDMQLN